MDSWEKAFVQPDMGTHGERERVGKKFWPFLAALSPEPVSSVAVVASSTIVSKNCLGLMLELNLTQEIKPQLSCSYFDDHDHCN